MTFPHFVNVLVLLFLQLSSASCLYVQDTSSLWSIWLMVCNYFATDCTFFFPSPPLGVFLKTKVLNFDEAELVKYSRYESCSWYESKNSLLRLDHKDFLFFENIL